jgi:hypothetical protein
MAATFTARSAGMTMDGDETQQPRRSRVPDLLRYEERYETSSTQQQRTKGKITTNTMRENVRRRVDVGAEIMCVMLAVDQMQRGEWECWIGLKEGVLFEPKPKRSRKPGRRTWFVIPPPARSATVEQVARHYGYTERSVAEMDRRARKTLNEIRAAAGLTGDVPSVPVWPAVMSQRAMLKHLFG